MKCRKCGKEAVGMIKKTGMGKMGLINPHFWYVYEAVCEHHLKEEEERLRNI